MKLKLFGKLLYFAFDDHKKQFLTVLIILSFVLQNKFYQNEILKEKEFAQSQNNILDLIIVPKLYKLISQKFLQFCLDIYGCILKNSAYSHVLFCRIKSLENEKLNNLFVQQQSVIIFCKEILCVVNALIQIRLVVFLFSLRTAE